MCAALWIIRGICLSAFAAPARGQIIEPPKFTKQDPEKMAAWARFSEVKTIYLGVDISAVLSSFLTEEQVRTDAELALRSRGLDVSASPSFEDQLIVTIHALPIKESVAYAVTTEVRFVKPMVPFYMIAYCSNQAYGAKFENAAMTVCMERNSYPYTAFEKTDLLVLGVDKIAHARQSAKDLVDAFILEWMKVNPKK